MKSQASLILIAGLITATFGVSTGQPPAGPDAIVFRDDFETLDTTLWDVQPVESWGAGRLLNGTDFAILIEPGLHRPPVHRPRAHLVLREQVWENVEVTTRFKTLYSDKHAGRDIVIIFGYQDDTHYYYAHLCDDSGGEFHNVIVRVDGDARSIISTPDKPEPQLRSEWQTARLIHSETGRIEVFFGETDEPYLAANDNKYPSGRVGIGSFNDTAAFDWIEIRSLSQD